MSFAKPFGIVRRKVLVNREISCARTPARVVFVADPLVKNVRRCAKEQCVTNLALLTEVNWVQYYACFACSNFLNMCLEKNISHFSLCFNCILLEIAQ